MRKVVLIALALLASPLGLRAEFMRERDGAYELARAGKWDEAAGAFRKLLEANPFDGRLWYQFGLASARLGDCRAASPALDKAIALGIDGRSLTMSKAHVEAAACALSLGDRKRALSHLETVNGPLARAVPTPAMDPRFAPLAGDSRYLTLSGQLDYKSLGRIEGWRADLGYFDDLARRRHARLFHTVSEAQWREAVEKLHRDVPRLSDAEVTLGFIRLAAMVGDGHTAFFPAAKGPGAMHMLPIWPQALGEHWVVVSAHPDHAPLVGAKVLSINGQRAAPDARSLAEIVPRDNPRTPLWLGSYAMQFAEGASGAYGKPTRDVVLELEMADGSRKRVEMRGGPITRDPSSRWAPEGWPTLGDAAPRPLWLSRTQDPFWFVDLAAIGAVYAQVNQVNDAPGLPFAEFARKLGEHLLESGAKRLILDLRHNNGGNAHLNWNLVRQVVLAPGIDKAGGLFVITGRRTFSASQSLITMLDEMARPIFVGEPASSRPSFYGESHPLALPWSGLQGSISNEWHQGWAAGLDSRPWNAPDIAAPPTAESLRAGRDPALEAIAAYLEAGR